MISVSMALALKKAGLRWEPSVNDFFTVPDSGLEDRVFVLSDVSASVGRLRGTPVVIFHGSVEWALDYIYVDEVVWLPTEAQLREAIERRLVGIPGAGFSLHNTPDGYVCRLQHNDDDHRFEAFGAAEVYARALLYLLQGN